MVERARGGDESAFADIVDATGDRCYGIAYRILRDEALAQDAVQQAYLLAWRELPRLRDISRFDAWLYRLLINACYEESRRRRRWSRNVRAIEAAGSPHERDFAALEHRDAIERAFHGLSPEHRAVFVMHHYAGTPLADIAAVMGVPLGTVKSRLHNATKSLRAALVADAAAAEAVEVAR